MTRTYPIYYYYLPIWMLLFSVIACSEKEPVLTVKNNGISLIKEHDSLYYIEIKSNELVDHWELPYPVYQFKVGDIDNDGKEDMMVGVIKTTRFDTVSGKRLFIFKNYKGYVRPLWLGSRLSQPLIDFNFVITDSGARIRSIEKEKSGNVLVAEYKWRRFGLEFTRYLDREIDHSTAKKELE
ncbi:hypothetical protein GCM10022393_02550 [Aquimarina addita]|uniref:VCBS repeat-containing protein n=1 Tax=Aquimarina addita TaxID=870485 RepID=A0ABP7X8J9_9FLAO